MGLGIMLPKPCPIKVVLKAVIQLPDRSCQPQPLPFLQCTFISLLITQPRNPPILRQAYARGPHRRSAQSVKTVKPQA